MTANNKFNKTFDVDGDEFQFYGPIVTVISVSYTSNTKVRGTNQVYAINGTISSSSNVTSTVEEMTDIWCREADGSEKNIRVSGHLPVRAGHTLYRISLAGKKVISDEGQVGTFDKKRHVPYSLYNHDTGNYIFRVRPKQIFTQTGESAGWVPQPDGLTWIIMLLSIGLWGIGLIPIIYILYKAYRLGGIQFDCFAQQEKIAAEHEKFLKELAQQKTPLPESTEATVA